MNARFHLPKPIPWIRLGEAGILLFVVIIILMELTILIPAAAEADVPLQHPAVTMVWTVGTFGSEPGQFKSPLGVAADAAGNIYVADRGNHRIQKFSADGQFTAAWPGDDAGLHPFVEPSGIAINPQDQALWILDSSSGWIYRLDANGSLEARIDGTPLGLYSPRGLAVGPNGDLFLADTGGARILHIDTQGTLLSRWGSFGTELNQFQDPIGIAPLTDGLAVIDTGNQRLHYYTFDGNRIYSADVEAGVSWVAGDGAGQVYVSNTQTHAITVFDTNGQKLAVLMPNVDIPSMDGPTGLAALGQGRICVVSASQLVLLQIEWK
jgi:DNA-binding beta-propeller fold protein YncE